MAAVKFAIKQFVVTTASFVPITTPIDCNYWTITCPVNLTVCSDPTDATTQKAYAAGMPYGASQGAVHFPTPFSNRFNTGDILCYAQGASKNGTATLEVVS